MYWSVSITFLGCAPAGHSRLLSPGMIREEGTLWAGVIGSESLRTLDMKQDPQGCRNRLQEEHDQGTRRYRNVEGIRRFG